MLGGPPDAVEVHALRVVAGAVPLRIARQGAALATSTTVVEMEQFSYRVHEPGLYKSTSLAGEALTSTLARLEMEQFRCQGAVDLV